MAAASDQKTNQGSFTMRVTLLAIRNRFPKVEQLDTEVLESWMSDSETNNLVLLDVRETDEYEVSHLPGAISVKPDEPVNQVITTVYDTLKDRGTNRCVKIVAYCSLGYRSSNMAQKIYHELKRMKETNGSDLSFEVYNLEGSIFKWANEGRLLVNCQNQETQYCHPYNALWGRLLSDNLRKFQPHL